MSNNYFDQSAILWDKDISKVERAQALAHEITELISEHSYQTALDFGCGTGLLSFYLKEQFSEVHLVDNSRGMIDIVNQKIELDNISHFVSYCNNIEDIHNLKVDVIYTNLTLHHIDNVEGLLSHLHHLLNPKGMLIISDLVEEDGSFHAQNNEPIPHNGFNQLQLQQQLKQCGFSPLSYKVYHTLHKNDKLFPLFIQVAHQ